MYSREWRSTHLLNGSNDLVVLPNSSLAKAQLTNLSSPNRSHGVKLRIRLMPTMAPSGIDKIMRTVLLSSNSIMLTPAPTTEIKSLDAQAIERLDLRRWGRREHDRIAAEQHSSHDFIDPRRRHRRHQANAQFDAVASIWATQICELRLGKAAVRQHDKIVGAIEEMGRAPFPRIHPQACSAGRAPG